MQDITIWGEKTVPAKNTDVDTTLDIIAAQRVKNLVDSVAGDFIDKRTCSIIKEKLKSMYDFPESETICQCVIDYKIEYEKKRLVLYLIMADGVKEKADEKIHSIRLGKRKGKNYIDQLLVNFSFKPEKPSEYINISVSV